MPKPNLITPIYKSIVRATVEAIRHINDLGFTNPPIQYHNWEERVNEDRLPAITLIGTDGFGFDENNGLWIVRYALAISSYNDSNLLNEMEIVDELHKRFGVGCKVPLLEMETGSEVSELVSVEFRLMPMGQSELRNYRTMGIELNRTGA